MSPTGPEPALPARTEEDFIDRILVDCPVCGGLAIVRPETGDHADLVFGPRRMTCTACGAHRTRPASALSAPAMDLPLRLVADSRHGTLHAFNEAHLDHIEAWVRSDLRREQIQEGGPRNRTIPSRLPAWVKAAGNRAEVLKLIARMREKLG